MTASERNVVAWIVLAHWIVGAAIILTSYYGEMPLRWHLFPWTGYRVLLWLAFLPVVVGIASQFGDQVRGVRVLALFAAVVVCAFVAEAAYFASLNLVIRVTAARQRPFNVSAAALMSLTYPAFVLTSAALMIVLRRTARGAHAQALALVRSEEKLAEARLSLLQAQLQPHFLFNSLNSLMTMVRHDAEGARVMLEHLEAYYLATANSDSRLFFTVDEELSYIRQYAAIERVRFGERLRLSINADPRALDATVPAFILQPLVENAIRHGVARVRAAGFVIVEAVAAGDDITITVTNNCDSAAGEWREGTGLRNTSERLAHVYGDRASLRTEYGGGSARISLRVPRNVPATVGG
jgi:two-component system, LytTR family, sensor kinase